MANIKHEYIEGVTNRVNYIMETVKYYENDYSEKCGYSRRDVIEKMAEIMANLHEKIFKLEDDLQRYADIIMSMD